MGLLFGCAPAVGCADGEAKDVTVVLLGGVRELEALPGPPAEEDEFVAAVRHRGQARPHARGRNDRRTTGARTHQPLLTPSIITAVITAAGAAGAASAAADEHPPTAEPATADAVQVGVGEGGL